MNILIDVQWDGDGAEKRMVELPNAPRWACGACAVQFGKDAEYQAKTHMCREAVALLEGYFTDATRTLLRAHPEASETDGACDLLIENARRVAHRMLDRRIADVAEHYRKILAEEQRRIVAPVEPMIVIPGAGVQ